MTPDIPVRSKKLSRQVRRYLGSVSAEQQIYALYSWLTSLPESQRPGLVADRLARFPDFLEVIDKSYAEYEDKIKMISRCLEISSQELNISNRRLEDLNEAISTMLDSLGQGLVFFDARGICSSVYSRACESLLDVAPGDKKIFDVLRLPVDQADNFHSWLEIVFSSSTPLSFGDMGSLAPDVYINQKNQYIQLEYRPVLSLNNELSAVLLIATDRSLEKKAEETLKETQTLSQVIVSIARNRNEFCSFIRNVRSLISDMSERAHNDPVEALREFHTYKGLAYHFGLEKMGDALHKAEDHIKDISDQRDIDYCGMLDDIDRELRDANRLAEDILGKDYMDRGYVRTIELSKIRFLKERLMLVDDKQCDALRAFIDDEMLGSSIEECFSVFETEIVRIAGMHGKPAPQIFFHTSVHSIVAADYGGFFETLVHLARNIIEHGIEEPIERRKAGKPEKGRIDIHVTRQNGKTSAQKMLRIVIRDDGRGFRPDVLRARLAALGLHEGPVDDLPDEFVIEYIFHPGFSTQSAVSSFSGRGVGMYALRKLVEGLGGTCRACSVRPGAEFTFDLPLYPQPSALSAEGDEAYERKTAEIRHSSRQTQI